MPFAYYDRLTAKQQRIYRESDEIDAIHLSQVEPLYPLVVKLAEALKREHCKDTETACQELLNAMTARLKVPPVRVKVYLVRPSWHSGELHGLYTPAERRALARIALWMRTAQRRQVVAFRSFLRTLLHELCHHLDYELLKLPDSFHTEGFYRRESSLFHQLVSTDSGLHLD